MDQEVFENFKNDVMSDMQELIDKAHKYGLTVPDKLKDHLKSHPLGQ